MIPLRNRARDIKAHMIIYLMQFTANGIIYCINELNHDTVGDFDQIHIVGGCMQAVASWKRHQHV